MLGEDERRQQGRREWVLCVKAKEEIRELK